MRQFLSMHSRALLLIAWVGLISGLLLTGAYRDYVAGWHVYLQVLALLILAFTFVGEVIKTALAQAGGHAHDHECGHPGHSHDKRPNSVRILAHLVPLVLFAAVGPATLGIQAPSKGGFSPSPGAATSGRINKTKEKYTADGYLATNVLKLHQRFRQGKDLPKKVVLVGQIYNMPPDKIPNLPPALRKQGVTSFFFRYVMTCCAADARPASVGLVTKAPIAADSKTWFQIKGLTQVIAGEKKFITLVVESADKVPKPANPYLSAFF